MAKVKVSLVKKSKGMKAAAKGAKATGDEFVFVDNEDSTCTVFGVDAAGAQVDISGVATLDPAPTSSDPATISVDPPIGMTFKMHGLKPSTAAVDINAMATWTDGSIGPFSFTLPCTTTSGGPTGIIIVPGTPVVR